MGKVISRKSELTGLVEQLSSTYGNQQDTFWHILNTDILPHKIKFPLLEYVGRSLYDIIPEFERIEIVDKIVEQNQIGSFVIAGIMLQMQLESDIATSLEKAVSYIISGDAWYVCDIIGERVFGYGLLHHFEQVFPFLTQLSHHSNLWAVRSIGPGIHYATKKGLEADRVKPLFELLLTKGNAKEHHVRSGIGWAAKTIAKFHPSIIQVFDNQIYKSPHIDGWFKLKVRIGLERSALKRK